MEALKDVRILNMTHVQAGPTCSQLLAGHVENAHVF